MIAYKFLRADGTGVFTRFAWPLPDGAPGAWVEAPVVPCRSGIHACRAGDLPLWLGRELYAVELAGEVVEERTKLVAPRARLVRRIDGVGRRAPGRLHARLRRLGRTRSPAPPARRCRTGRPRSSRRSPRAAALLGFIAASIAEARGGIAAYRAERARQAAWLTERLGL